MRRRLSMLLLLLIALLVATPAHAEDEPSPRARRGRGLLTGGAVTFTIGWALYALKPLSCGGSDERDFAGRARCDASPKLLVPFAGYALYLADPERREAQRQVESNERARRARGDGCMNSAIGCGFGDTLDDVADVLAWTPTVLQIVGAALVVGGGLMASDGGGATKASSPPAPRRSTLAATPILSPGHLGLQLGLTF